jgi:hypothetical protein
MRRGNIMPKKFSRGAWSMQHDRELIALVKAHMLLQTVAKKLDRPITTIIRRTARLGVSIERIAKAKEITSLSRWLDGLGFKIEVAWRESPSGVLIRFVNNKVFAVTRLK